MSDYARRVGDDAIRFERRYRTPIARVWRALVTSDGVSKWLGSATIDPRVGGAFEIRFSDEDRMNGTILEFEPDRRLVLAWREESNGVPSQHSTRDVDESVVTFDLRADADGGTTLTFTHAYVRPGERTIEFGAGWHSHFDALVAALDEAPAVDRDARYAELRPDYERLFGAATSTVR